MAALNGGFGLPFMNVEWPTGIQPFEYGELEWNPYYLNGEMLDIAALPQDGLGDLPLIFMAEKHNGKKLTELHIQADTSIEELFNTVNKFDTTSLVDEGAHMVIQPVNVDGQM